MTIDELFRQARAGDKSAENAFFSILSERFRLFLQRKIADTRDAEDVMQNSLVAIADKYRSLPADCQIAGWAHQVLNFEILRYYRAKGLHAERHLRSTGEETAFHGWECEASFREAMSRCLVRLHKVNPNYARVLNLHYQGYTTGEVCNRLGITANHYYVILLRARSQLRLCLQEEESARE